jgi:hypothetical protein
MMGMKNGPQSLQDRLMGNGVESLLQGNGSQENRTHLRPSPVKDQIQDGRVLKTTIEPLKASLSGVQV